MLLDRFPDLEDMRVVDLGGTPTFWSAAPVKPATTVVVNLDGFRSLEGIEVVVADACEPPDWLADFDLVFSNSLMEHLGGYTRRRRFADVIRSLAPRHWIQTPYRYFPVEPHWLFPGFQFMPLNARAALTRWWPLGHIHQTGPEAVDRALSVELIGRTEMRFLFPDSAILTERFLGLPKSLIAVRA
jgi:hypothetical protein